MRMSIVVWALIAGLAVSAIPPIFAAGPSVSSKSEAPDVLGTGVGGCEQTEYWIPPDALTRSQRTWAVSVIAFIYDKAPAEDWAGDWPRPDVRGKCVA